MTISFPFHLAHRCRHRHRRDQIKEHAMPPFPIRVYRMWIWCVWTQHIYRLLPTIKLSLSFDGKFRGAFFFPFSISVRLSLIFVLLNFRSFSWLLHWMRWFFFWLFDGAVQKVKCNNPVSIKWVLLSFCTWFYFRRGFSWFLCAWNPFHEAKFMFLVENAQTRKMRFLFTFGERERERSG